MEAIKLSVRKVVELVLRCGDIDSRYVDSAVMWNGAKAHKKLQKEMGPDYHAELSLSVETVSGGIPLLLQGRADGVIFTPDGFVVDEIKTTTLPLDKLALQQELHLGQAKCYAYMLLQKAENPPQRIGVQLTYHQLDENETKRTVFEYTAEEITAFFYELMERYGVWLRWERDWTETRTASIKTLAFPFPNYRAGQRELAEASYRTIRQGKKLYAQAPTGIGKTLSTLFPSVKAMGEGLAEKIFYLTAKTVTRTVAEEAVRLMADKGLRFKSVTLRAKEKICPQSEVICTPDFCPRARGHYDRVNDAVLDILGQGDLITPDIVSEYCDKHRVCPHETALDVALWADLVVCDYNHVFDPVVYLKRFFNDNSGSYVFLIDETHNLVERVRDMYTAALSKLTFGRLKRAVSDKNSHSKRLRKHLGQMERYLTDLGKELGDVKQEHRVDEELDTVFKALVLLFTQAAEEWLSAEQHSAHPFQSQVLELYFEAMGFLNICELYDRHYTTIVEVEGPEVTVTLFCLDPSQIIGDALERAVATILFSATLTPLPYYRDILGGAEGDYLLSLPSPFPQERLLLAAHTGISTKYNHRPQSIAPIAEAIRLTVSQRKGNYLVFFPSYEYMRQVHEAFTEACPDVEALLQQGRMNEEERLAFLSRFDEDNPETLVGFAVLGGIFSEGIDLKGERLIGSIVVGVGLPGISLRQDLIRDYFNGRNGSGFDYAYVYPGMNKVLQAAGRVIRSEEDFGVVLLLDSRFGTPQYKRLYPKFWSHMQLVRSDEELALALEDFPFFKQKKDG